MSDLRYPVGRFTQPASLTPAERSAAIQIVADAPRNMRTAVNGLNEQQIDTPYRPEGWTVRQVVHHVPDSHMNAYIRFKLALTEDTPTIKPYDEAAWAKLADTANTPIKVSLDTLENLHARWVILLRAMSPGDFSRMYNHPEMGKTALDQVLAMYAWHSRHHVAHIAGLRERSGW